MSGSSYEKTIAKDWHGPSRKVRPVVKKNGNGFFYAYVGKESIVKR
jgi:hypothetical protein